MGLKSLLSGKPKTTVELEDQIASQRAAVEQLTDTHARAEADAVDAAADEKYEDAAAQVAAIKLRLTSAQERLTRLQAAHAEAAAREQEDYIKRLEARKAQCESQERKTLSEVVAGRTEEQARNVEALADLDRREKSARQAVANAEHDLRRAKAGFPERSAARLKELHAQYMEVESRYGPDLDHRLQQASGRFTAARRVIEDNKPREGKVGGFILPEWQQEFDDAEGEFKGLAQNQDQRNQERKPITAETEQLRASLPSNLR